jgi:hypothetical protein
VSHLTAQINYAQNENVLNNMQFKKQFLLDNIEKFKIKHSKTAKNSPDRNVNNKKSDKSE